MKDTKNICYLCGKKITGSCTRDHVPPKQFYPKGIRNKLHLTTLCAHKECNISYQKDEDYFVSSLGPLAMETNSGKLLWNDLKRRMARPEEAKLVKKVLGEFDTKIALPGNQMIKHFEGDRICRVLWKITKGLYFIEKNQFLPDDVFKRFEIFSNSVKQVPPMYNVLLYFPSRGEYPYVFDFRIATDSGLPNVMIIAMLFWEKIIGIVMFYEPGYSGNICKNDLIKRNI